MDSTINKEKLFELLLPALRSKQKMLKKVGVNYVKVEDIWNYLSLHVWIYKNHLALNDLVADIFDLSNLEITNYVKNLMGNIDRPPIF